MIERENCAKCGGELTYYTRSSDFPRLCQWCGRRLEDEQYRIKEELEFREREEREEAEREKREREDHQRASNSACFISTATTVSVGLPDDCDQLNTLRKFRDEYIKKMPNGEQIIEEYYASAPLIVNNISLKENSREVFFNIYNSLVEPCYKLIKNGRDQEAFELYRYFYQKLKTEHI